MENLDDELHEGEPPPLPTDPRYYPIHPLFPLPEGVRETKEIAEITFDRWDHQGKKERCPDRFPASELRSLAQVIDMFGGGTYQFIAFDSRGSYSRWTPEKDKVRVGLPCKPFRHVEHESLPEAPAAKAAPAPSMPSPTHDLVPLLVAAQERADRMLTALLERIAGAQHPPPPPPAPALDPMVMLTGLATVMEKLRPPVPPSGGDMIGQLSGLVGIAKQLGGKSAPAPAEEESALQPLITMMTSAMTQSAPALAPAAPAPPAPSPAPRNDLIWVDLPHVGQVMMRPEQATSVLARLAAPVAPMPEPAQAHRAKPAAEVTTGESRPFASSWDDVAERLRDPAAQLAFKQALERLVSPSGPLFPTPSNDVAPAVASPAPAAVPTAKPPNAPAPEASNVAPSAAPQAPAAGPPASAPPGESAPAGAPPRAREQAAQPTAEAPTPRIEPTPSTAAVTAATPPSAPACIVCGAGGTMDRTQPNVLLCRNGHRSLTAPPAEKEANEADELIPLDAISTEHIELALRDEEGLKAMLPQMVADLRRELDARRGSGGRGERAG